MAKTYGAVDRRARRRRSDYGRKRKKYNGKPVKGTWKRRLERRQGNKTILKLWVWEKRPMDPDHYRCWNRHVRRYIRPIVYKPIIRADISIEYLTTKEDFEQAMLDVIGYDGEFLIMGFSRTWRNAYHVKPVKICRIVIRNAPEGLYARMINNYRLWRYWFWKDR